MKMVHVHVDVTAIHNSILVHKLKGSNCLIYNMNTLRKRPQEIASGKLLDMNEQ